MSKFISIAKPKIGIGEMRSVYRVLRSGNLAQGPEVEVFESEFSKVLNLDRHCVAVNSGTSGLHLALLTAGIGQGDEVIIPSFTFAATANAVVLAGAEPVFVDIEPKYFNLNSEVVSQAITDRTKAIIVVHLYGHSAEMSSLVNLAKSRGIKLIEDAAQSHGSSYQGKPVGSFGDFGVFSFYPTKNMTTGEGGMISVADQDSLRHLRLLRNQGMERRYENEIVGFNLRMTDMQAAIGRVQLQRLEKWTNERRRNASFLTETIDSPIRTPESSPVVRHVFHQYTIRVSDDRDGFAKALSSEFGIGAGVYYPNPCHRLASLKRFRQGTDLSETEKASAEVLSIPVRPGLSVRELHRIGEAVNKLARAGS